jgi:alpha-tubulin suppressor-like RCC1 family protein
MSILVAPAILTACSLINDFSVGDGGHDAGQSDGAVDPQDSGFADASVGGGPCPVCMTPTPICDPMSERCVECVEHRDCDDGVACTVDRCDLVGTCENAIDGRCISSIAAAGAHTCATVARGALYCWGNNSSGQVGDGSTGTNRTRPLEPGGAMNALEAAVGFEHSCILRMDGSVLCWGDNGFGQLGTGASMNSAVPVEVADITSGAAIAAGYHHVCVLNETGRVFCWGRNTWGQLGDGTSDDRSLPTPVLDLVDAVEISAGGHTCARRSSGRVACWGHGLSGELGDGRSTNSALPVEVLNINDATQVTVGGGHTCAVHGSGRVACWGYNASRQLGDGSTVNSGEPVPVSGLSEIAEVRA